MIELQIDNLERENNLSELDSLVQNSICGGIQADNSIIDYGTSSSSFNITKLEAGDTDFVVNQVNTIDRSVELPFENRSKVWNDVNILGDGVVDFYRT